MPVVCIALVIGSLQVDLSGDVLTGALANQLSEEMEL